MANPLIPPARAIHCSQEEIIKISARQMSEKRTPVLHDGMINFLRDHRKAVMQYEELPMFKMQNTPVPGPYQRLYVTEYYAVNNGQVIHQNTADSFAEDQVWLHPKTMNKKHSRMWLLLDDLHIERIQTMNAQTCKASGFDSISDFVSNWNELSRNHPKFFFERNPWVWVKSVTLITDKGWEGFMAYRNAQIARFKENGS